MNMPVTVELRDLDGTTFAIVLEECQAEVEFLIDPKDWPAIRAQGDAAYAHWKEVK